jgi:hypothetical protein
VKKTLQKLVFREKPDGRRAMGFLPLFLLFVGTIVAMIYVHSQMSAPVLGGTAVRTAATGPKSDVSQIADTAQTFRDNQQKPEDKSAQSYRGVNVSPLDNSNSAVPNAVHIVDSLNTDTPATNLPLSNGVLRGEHPRTQGEPTINPVPFAGNHSSPPPAPDALGPMPASAHDSSDSSTGAPAPTPTQAPASNPDDLSNLSNGEGLGSGKLPDVNLAQVVVYTNPSLNGSTNATVAAPPTDPGFTTNNFLPRGTQIPVVVVSDVNTGNVESPVEMMVAHDIVFQGNVVLRFGTKILGAAAADGVRNRVLINADTILYPDGRELPLSALVMGDDLSTGVPAYFIPIPVDVAAFAYANQFLVSYLQQFGNNSSNTVQSLLLSNGVAGALTNNGTFSAKDAAVNAGSNAIQQFASQYGQTLYNLNAPHLFLPKGSTAVVYLRSAVDFTKAIVNGSARNRQPILPGFQNNPVLANGIAAITAADSAMQGGGGGQYNYAPGYNGGLNAGNSGGPSQGYMPGYNQPQGQSPYSTGSQLNQVLSPPPAQSPTNYQGYFGMPSQ